MINRSLLALTLAGGAACGDKIEAAKQAVEAAQAAAESARPRGDNEGTDAAATPGSPLQAAAEMTKAIGQHEASGQVSGSVVGWRQLVEFLPENIGAFQATGDVDGKTTQMGGIEVTVVKRRYSSGKKGLRVTITDTVFAPMMRTPFKMAAMVQEDSRDGYKKGVKLKGHPALAEWNKRRKVGSVAALIGERFLLEVRVTAKARAGEAEKIAKGLPLEKLAEVKPAAG